MAPHAFVEEKTLGGISATKAAWTATDLPHKLVRHHADAPRVFAEWNETGLAPTFRDWSIEEYLPVIRCPVLAIQGVDDEYATMRQIDVIAEQVPDTILLKLSRCGHSPHRDQPALALWAADTLVRQVAGWQ